MQGMTTGAQRSEVQSDAAPALEQLPGLPPEVWKAIAGATLAACGCSLGAWLRLRAVSRNWRQALEGAGHGSWLHQSDSCSSLLGADCPELDILQYGRDALCRHNDVRDLDVNRWAWLDDANFVQAAP